MKQLVMCLCLFASIAGYAQKQKTEAYIANYKELAMTEMMRTGVPAAITLAQGILESQSGESDLVRSSNNHFGIKCKTEWTGQKTYHDDDAKGECFRVYPTPDDSFKDHSDFLKSRPHYAFLFQLDPTDFEGWAKGLKKAGYATNPAYPQKLLKLINDYNLQQYSLLAMTRQQETPATVMVNEANGVKEVTVAKEVNVVKEENGVKEPDAMSMVTSTPIAVITTVHEPVAETAPAVATKKTVSYPAGTFSINHTKVIYGSAGTSLLSLADKYDLTLSKLLEYNELAEMDVLDMDRLVYLEKKPKKGATDFHTVAEGESLHDICQLEGIRLENLLEYNNLKKDGRVSAGEKIYLRTITQTAGKAGKAKKITG